MKLNGRVIEGRIELDGNVDLPEGTPVEVTIPDSRDVYVPTEEEDELLWQSNQEIERGEFLTGEELLAKLRATRNRQ